MTIMRPHLRTICVAMLQAVTISSPIVIAQTPAPAQELAETYPAEPSSAGSRAGSSKISPVETKPFSQVSTAEQPPEHLAKRDEALTTLLAGLEALLSGQINDSDIEPLFSVSLDDPEAIAKHIEDLPQEIEALEARREEIKVKLEKLRQNGVKKAEEPTAPEEPILSEEVKRLKKRRRLTREQRQVIQQYETERTAFEEVLFPTLS